MHEQCQKNTNESERETTFVVGSETSDTQQKEANRTAEIKNSENQKESSLESTVEVVVRRRSRKFGSTSSSNDSMPSSHVTKDVNFHK